MSADLIRRAAEVLRERAEKATPGPWSTSSAFGDTANLLDARGALIAEGGPIEDGGDWFGAVSVLDATYIATVHPGVALALAEIIASEAKWVDDGYQNRRPGADVVRLCRLILGEPEPT